VGLRAKFNLAILVAFALGFCITGVLLKANFEESARAQSIQNARVMMSAANAVRHYTIQEVEPIVGLERDGKFITASVPSFAAQATFRTLSAEFPAFAYKEAVLNPTNPTDRATDWEADIVNAFRHSTTQKEVVVERGTPTGESLTLARPISVSESACLSCHSQPAAAPAAMLASYGNANGFGWHLHEIVGAQIVSLPLAVPMGKAHQSLLLFLGLLTAVFLLMLLVLNVLLHYLVIRPVARMSAIATQVSLGDMTAEQFNARGRDEVASLSSAFNRMRRSLETALHLLDENESSSCS
jgi:HAMP domain-containing protein